MAVLLQYNDSDHWTMAQLAESTQIKKDILVQVFKKINLLKRNFLVQVLSFNNAFIRSRLMWSLWDQWKLISLSEWLRYPNRLHTYLGLKSVDGPLSNWSHKPIDNIISDYIKRLPL